MADPVFYGICSNCIHARTCRYALNAARPVHFCDIYEVNGKEVQDAPVETPRRRTRSDGVTAGRFRGLCVDCEKRHQCDRARTESGVWRCEDYQSRPEPQG
jgi:hypothetical protein